MSLKILADTFSITRDSSHLVILKTIKKPRSEDQVWLTMELVDFGKFGRAAGQKIIETIEEVFFESADKPYERFENTLKEINLILKKVQEKKGATSPLEVNAIIAVLSGTHLYLTQSRKAEAYLIRGGKCSLISDEVNSKSSDTFASIASGDLRDNDKVVLSTQRLLRFFTNSQLAQTFGNGITESLDMVKERVLDDKDMSVGVSCIHTKIHSPSTPGTREKRIGTGTLFVKTKASLQTLRNFVLAKLGRKQTEFNQSTILAILVAVVILLVVSVSVLMDGSHNRALREEYRLKIESLNQDLHTATTKGYSNDKESANAILDKVERESRGILETNYFRTEALSLLDKVQETRDSVNNTMRVKDIVPLADLSAKNPAVAALGFLNLDEHFYAFEYNRLYEVILDKVLDPKPIDDKEVVTAGAVIDDRGLLVFLTQSGRVIEYENGTFSFPSTEDASWQGGSDITAYGKNIYLLNPAKNQIYKYTRLRANYSAANEYNLDADLKGALSFTIDGSIYVLKQGGEIVKIFKGNKKDFSIDNLAVDLAGATQIYTSTELANIYVLDPANKRVVVIRKDKNGVAVYHRQIVLETLPEARRIYVNDAENKLYVLTGSKIYGIDL